MKTSIINIYWGGKNMKKYFVLGVLIIFIFLTFTPYINALDISKESDAGFDIAIIDIIPYLWEPEEGQAKELHFTLEVKNLGDLPYSDWVKYNGTSSFFITNNSYGTAWGGRWGVLDPGESYCPQSGDGLLFVNFIPRIFSLEYKVTPIDSNPDNNYIKQVYLIRGDGIFPFWIRIPFLE